MNNIKDELLLRAFGDHLRALRETYGLTQKDLALASDIEKSQIARAEYGANITMSTLFKISEGLGIPAYEIFADFNNLKHKK